MYVTICACVCRIYSWLAKRNYPIFPPDACIPLHATGKLSMHMLKNKVRHVNNMSAMKPKLYYLMHVQ